MTPIRPQDLPELRAKISEQFTRLETLVRLYGPEGMPPPRKVNGVAAWLVETIGHMELYYVSSDMSALVETAAAGLESFGLTPEDLPAPAGLLIFDDEGTGPWGVAWMSDPQALTVMPVLRADHGPHRGEGLCAMPDGSFAVAFGAQISEFKARHAGFPPGLFSGVMRKLITSWLLMSQPLARTAQVEPDRAARKRLRRMNHEPASVRVIELRRPASAGGGHGESGREYRHQWITRGHWRNQWHPKREVHRPVWIAPHVKGPAGAPLIGGEKVYALKR